MSITLLLVLRTSPRGVFALVQHEDAQLEVEVAVSPAQAATIIGQPLTAELSFQSVQHARILERDRPENHGFVQLGAGAVRITGRVHKAVAVDERTTIVDVYLQAGPEFASFESTTLGFVPAVGAGIEVDVNGLCFFPTRT